MSGGVDALGDRMKGYERAETARAGMPGLPICIRLDGRAFSSFTQGLERPYDKRLSDMMLDLTIALCEESNARVGYTQSDEISLVLWTDEPGTQLYFGGKFAKLNSVLAGFAAAWFARELPRRIPEKAHAHPLFDCRAWNVPSLEEAANTILWREIDATKNSVQMLARCHYSHRELHGKGRADQLEMLYQKGVNWNEWPVHFKRGVYVRRETITRPFTADEIDALPPKHAARTNPSLTVERHVVRRLELPAISRLPNRVDVLFRGAAPAVSVLREAS